MYTTTMNQLSRIVCNLLWICVSLTHCSVTQSLGPKGSNLTFPFVRLGNKIYLIEQSAKLNWYGAAQSCRQQNMHLASFESEKDYNRLQRYLIDDQLIMNYFWTSGNDLETEGLFKWFGTGSPLKFFKWSNSEPNSEDWEMSNCVKMRRMGSEYVWKREICSQRLYYICEANYNEHKLLMAWKSFSENERWLFPRQFDNHIVQNL